MLFIHSCIPIVIFLLCISCSTGDKAAVQTDCPPITSDAFLKDPVEAVLNLRDFREQYGEHYKLKKFRRNLSNADHSVDTIYQFIRGDDAFIFYSSGSKDEESFLTLKIADDRMKLGNCIRVGMKRSRVEELISDFPAVSANKVKIDNGQKQAVFIFSGNQLEKVHINNFYK
jgi:hypothetical protein